MLAARTALMMYPSLFQGGQHALRKHWSVIQPYAKERGECIADCRSYEPINDHKARRDADQADDNGNLKEQCGWDSPGHVT